MTFDPTNVFGHYILDDQGEPIPEPDLLTWGRWYQAHPTARIVAKDQDEGPDGVAIEVSTVFLGLDHRFLRNGPPILWETLVFGGLLDGEMDRYTSKQAALVGHQAMCERVMATLAKRTRTP